MLMSTNKNIGKIRTVTCNLKMGRCERRRRIFVVRRVGRVEDELAGRRGEQAVAAQLERQARHVLRGHLQARFEPSKGSPSTAAPRTNSLL